MRFPGFEGEWKWHKLGDIANISKGFGISKDQISEKGQSCILYGELYTKYKSEVIQTILSRTDINFPNLVKSKANDVIIPSSGETAIDIATARCVPFSDVLLGGDLNIIRLENDNGVFLSYQLNGVRKHDIAKIAQGISVVHLYGEGLKKLKIAICSNEEQKKIASFLYLIDERISTQNKIIEDLKLLKSTIREKIFSCQLKFKDDKGNNFPKWESKKIREIADITMGQSPDSSSYNNNNDGFPLIQGNADISRRKSDPRQYTTEPTKHCNIGDILLTVRAPVGYVAKAKHKACIGRGICAIKNNNLSISEFIYQFLLYFEDKWSCLEQGSTFSSVSSSDIQTLSIKMPCLEEQNKIVNFLSSIETKTDIEIQILQEYGKQKKHLMSNLFI